MLCLGNHSIKAELATIYLARALDLVAGQEVHDTYV